MGETELQKLAATKLHEIYKKASSGSEAEKTAIEGLVNMNTPSAVEKLHEIAKSAGSGSEAELSAIKGIEKIGRSRCP